MLGSPECPLEVYFLTFNARPVCIFNVFLHSSPVIWVLTSNRQKAGQVVWYSHLFQEGLGTLNRITNEKILFRCIIAKTLIYKKMKSYKLPDNSRMPPLTQKKKKKKKNHCQHNMLPSVKLTFKKYSKMKETERN